MFNKNLSEEMSHAEEEELPVILKFFASNDLNRLTALPLAQMCSVIAGYHHKYPKNYELLKNAVQLDTENKHPILYCFYALVTNNINELDLIKLGDTIHYLERNQNSHPEYKLLVDSLSAIDTIRNYTFDTKVNLPSNCYLNLASAALPYADLTNLDLRYANFYKANLDHADLSSCDLSNVQMNDVNACYANFNQAILYNAMLDGSMENASFKDADLCNARLCNLNLNLRNANLSNCYMNAFTVFFKENNRTHAREFNRYMAEKKAMISQIAFFDDEVLKKPEALEAALTRLYIMLEDNPDFPNLQECIGHDFIHRAQSVAENEPSLVGTLGKAAYNSSLFQHDFLLFRKVNDVSVALQNVFSNVDETRVIESKAQEQIRATLR